MEIYFHIDHALRILAQMSVGTDWQRHRIVQVTLLIKFSVGIEIISMLDTTVLDQRFTTKN